MLTEVGLRGYFETVVDSAVVGSVKPDARIFRIALERLDLPPADVVMVGDLPTADVFGPRALGIRAALVDPHDLHPWVPAPRFKDLGAFAAALPNRRGRPLDVPFAAKGTSQTSRSNHLKRRP